jgi:hypothetical protein
MNKNAALRRSAMREEGTDGRRQKSSLSPIVLAAIVAIGAIAVYRVWPARRHEKPVAKPISTLAYSGKAAPVGESSVDSPDRAQSSATVTPPSRPETAADRAGANANVSPESAQLVARLSQIDLTGGVLTAEQAKQLNQNFKQLAAQGDAAVPAIRQFLQRNQDLSFNEINGGKNVEYSSLRMGLIDALKQIGGPDAIALSRETLQTSADPLEVAILARNLDTLAPGQYRQEALNAARETLAQVESGQLRGLDVGPLFALLQTYGDASVMADLEKALPQWTFYATMALAGLPDGQGVEELVRQVEEPDRPGTTKNNFKYQMLAQFATQYPVAGAALLDQARQNQLSDAAWRNIAAGLGGDQYQFNNPLLNSAATVANRPGLKTYHTENGNQNFYSTPYVDNGSGEQIPQRLALIDQLLSTTTNPVAIQALQQARANLTGNQPGK